MYRKIGREFRGHGTTTHARMECVNPLERTIYTSTVEDVFSIVKRGMRGVYQHCQEHQRKPRELECDDANFKKKLGYLVRKSK